MVFYNSPISSITPALTSVAMSRSDSRDSTSTTSSVAAAHFSSAPLTVSYCASPVNMYSSALSRSDSGSSTGSRSVVSNQRRESSTTWSPYRSCMLRSSTEEQEPSSYLSDDDLLFIGQPAAKSEPPVESIPNLEPNILRRKELTTEEQIAMLRELQQKEQEQQQQQRRSSNTSQHGKTVRFANEAHTRRSSPKKRNPVTRKGPGHLTGPA